MKRRQRFWMKGGPHPTLSARARRAGTALLVGGVCLGATPVEAQPLPKKEGPRRIVAREERLWREEAWWREGPRRERAESGVVRRREWEYPKGRATAEVEKVLQQVVPSFKPPNIGLRDVGFFSSPEFADIDADGDLDAFIGDDYGNTYFLENTGTVSAPTFAAPQANPFGMRDVGIKSAPDLVDIDLDGDLDAFVGSGPGDIYFFQNMGTASSAAFAAPQVNPFGLQGASYCCSDPVLVDIDADGDLDAFSGSAVYDEAFSYLYFYENTGSASSPAFAARKVNPYGLQPVPNFSSPEFVDIDADGDVDAFIGDTGGTTHFFENTGTASNPAFAAPVAYPFGLYNVRRRSSPTLVDIDSDGDLDAFIGDFYGDTTIFRNIGTPVAPTFEHLETSSFGLQNLGFASSPDFADIDADGDPDAFIGEGSGTTYFFENTGTASAPVFSTPQANPFGLQDVAYSSSPEFADIDVDGDLDAFVGEGGGLYGSSGNTYFFENTGTPTSPTFAAPVVNPFGLYGVEGASHPTFVDIDGDGDLDAFIGNSEGNTFFFENTSAPTPTDTTPPECRLERVDAGPPAVLEVLTQDTGSGLASITVLTAENADVSGHTGFTVGTTEPITVTATKVDQSRKAVLALEVKDVAGNSVTCDPVVDQVSPEVPAAFSLEPNYPNPFNLQTAIPFRLPEGARVRLSVYDVLGREVAVLVDEEMAPGTYEAAFEASGLPAGTYFYRIEAGTFTAVRSLTLVK